MHESGRLFAYGTLQDSRLLARLAGRPLAGRAAVLRDYVRYTVAGEEYPGILPQEWAETDGMVFEGLRAEDWTRLDHYESDLYDRLPVTVHFPDGSACVAYAYVIPPENRSALSELPWDPHHYLPLRNEPG